MHDTVLASAGWSCLERQEQSLTAETDEQIQRKRWMWFAFDGCCRGKADDNADGRPVRFSSDVQQCACTAFSGDAFVKGTLPGNANQSM
jgi:hypothetical protein